MDERLSRASRRVDPFREGKRVRKLALRTPSQKEIDQASD